MPTLSAAACSSTIATYVKVYDLKTKSGRTVKLNPARADARRRPIHSIIGLKPTAWIEIKPKFFNKPLEEEIRPDRQKRLAYSRVDVVDMIEIAKPEPVR